MRFREKRIDRPKERVIYRTLLLVGGFIYLSWWFAVEAVLPGAFNPLGSRVAVVALFFLSYFGVSSVPILRRNYRVVFSAAMWTLTLHYYYLFYHNGPDINWIVGCYITVVAINLAFVSAPHLLAYSFFVFGLSIALVMLVPGLLYSVFLPGLITILVQANIGQRSRLRLILTLAESKERFRLLFDSSFEGVFLHENGVIISANESLAQMLGYRRVDFIGKDSLFFIEPESRALIQSKLHLDDTLPYEVVGVRADGKKLDIAVRGKAFRYKKRSVRLVTVQDITDRRRAENQKLATLSMQEKVRVRDEFISVASHELKTPLTALKLQAQLLERDVKRGTVRNYTDKDSDRIIGVLARQLDKLTKLVDTILDVSHITTGKLQLERVRLDFALLVRETTLALLHDLVKDKKLELLILGPKYLSGDPVRLRQLVENLLTNAVKYGNESKISVEVVSDDTYVTLRVEDHGKGISPAFQQKVFEKFEREDPSRDGMGLGLGLFISRQIVEAHGGTIQLESSPGKGSIFSVRLPAAP